MIYKQKKMDETNFNFVEIFSVKYDKRNLSIGPPIISQLSYNLKSMCEYDNEEDNNDIDSILNLVNILDLVVNILHKDSETCLIVRTPQYDVCLTSGNKYIEVKITLCKSSNIYKIYQSFADSSVDKLSYDVEVTDSVDVGSAD